MFSKEAKPISVWFGQGAEFNVYRARDMLTDKWNGDLKQLVLFCRESFFKYGQRPLLDDFDLKAAIYLVSADYEEAGFEVSEWLSIRMVPGWGYLLGVFELELYCLNGARLDKMLLGDNPENWKSIVSSSRMCHIKPTVKFSFDCLSQKSRFTAHAFALIHQQFIDDYEVDYQYITAIISDDFIKKGLTIYNSGRSATPHFVPAHELLNVKKDQITLDRSIYAYSFPTYWFNPADLLELIRRLLDRRLISAETLSCYFGVSDVSDITEAKLINMSLMFKQETKLTDALITGPELREISDRELSERPQLRITPVQVWNQAIGEMIETADLRRDK